jgi:hypothetical protein
MHVQCLNIQSNTLLTCITTGAVTAASLRYKHGGLSRIRDSLNASLDQTAQNHTLETRFYTRRKTLESAGSLIEALSRRINHDWHVGEFGAVDQVGLQLLSEVKQVSINFKINNSNVSVARTSR